ncbi:MAG: DUF4105 domain-containing protein [Planctomycetota bacterium]
MGGSKPQETQAGEAHPEERCERLLVDTSPGVVVQDGVAAVVTANEGEAPEPLRGAGRGLRRRLWDGVLRGVALVVLAGAAMCLGIMAGGGYWWPIFVAWAAGVAWQWRTGWPELGAGVLAVVVVGWVAARGPSHDREWRAEVSFLPVVEVLGDEVRVGNLRNFERFADGTFTPRWENRSYTLSGLRGVDLIVEPFAMSELVAHTMLSFDFGPEGRLVLSIEARIEEGEVYGPVAGALRQFELTYQFIDERDALTFRGVEEGGALYAYPIKADRAGLVAFFRRVAAEANAIHVQPRWYHIVYDNCTTAWVRALRRVQGKPFALHPDVVLNGRLARGLHGMGVIDTTLSYEDAREKFRIDEAVRAHFGAEDFSEAIRAGR